MIYFIQSVDGGLIKIGHADNVIQRFKDIQTHSPIKLRILKVIEGGRTLEKELHKRFVELISHGEWFLPDNALLLTVNNLPGLDLGVPDTVEECNHVTADRFKCRRYAHNGSVYCNAHDPTD